MPRKVAIQRTHGGTHPHFPVGTAREGWELTPPRPGEIYLLFTESGAVFRTSPVRRLIKGGFQTKNSVYRLLVLEETTEPMEGNTQELSPWS
ncbi:MAG: hypothetical protein ACUVS3_06315 [Thermodesulfobacteriota bacterium]